MDGWALDALCAHLEAVTFGDINRLLANVPPGFMKSLATDVFWPAWEWGAMNMPHLRYVTFSYSASLTERDNGRFRDLLVSREYQELYGDRFTLRKIGETRVTNDKMGWKLASSVGGVGTGERGDRVLLDDPHNVKEVESDTVRDETVRWFRESMSNRLNNDASAIVIIMQRLHEIDVSGTILAEGFDYCHLMIPMEYDEGRYPLDYQGTDIGWIDPREDLDELAWPERFSEAKVVTLKKELGPYAYAGQYQQSPVARGGGIFKRDWWHVWEPASNKWPTFDYLVGSLDSAFTAKEENDPSGMTVWGIFKGTSGLPCAMLVKGWRKHLEMHGPVVDRRSDETYRQWRKRSEPQWGLVEWVAETCRFRNPEGVVIGTVDRLIIEAKASGITAAQEIQRLYGDEGWLTELSDPRGDKVARAHSVVPIFANGQVWAPDRDWSDVIIDEMSVFPKGRYDDLCFVGETLIATNRGNVRIDQITISDLVLTPFGWRKVLAAGYTGIRPTITKQGLCGTSEHPVFDLDFGYRPLDSVTQASSLARLSICGLIKTLHPKSLSLMASFTDGWEERGITTSVNLPRPSSVKTPKGYTLPFGNFTTIQFLQSMKSITSMAIRLTSALKIWSAYRLANIVGCLRGLIDRSGLHSWNQSARWLRHGMDRLKALLGIVNMPRIAFASPVPVGHFRQSGESATVSGAGRSLNFAAPKGFFAHQYVSRRKADINAANLDTFTHMQPVFNLTVEGEHCYYANGVLVHNCDSVTQALRHLRVNGLLQQREELRVEDETRSRLRRKTAPLYPA